MSGLAMAGLSAGVGALSGLFSGIGANKRLDKSLEAQAKENEKARQWNKEMAEWSLSEQRKDVENQRLYDSPAEQRKRLAAAGLNPDLMYGNGASGLVSGSFAQQASVDSVSPANVGSLIASSPTMGESMIRGIEAAKTLAETQNISADTKKKEGEITSLDIDNMVQAQTAGKRIELAGMNVTLAKDAHDLNRQNLANLTQQLQNLQTENEQCNQAITESMARVRNLDANTLNQRVSTLLSSERFALEVRKFQQDVKESDSRINLNNAEARSILVLMLSKKLNLDMNTMAQKAGIQKMQLEKANLLLQSEILDVTGRQLNFDYKQNTKFSDAERGIKIVTDAIGSVGGIISDIVLFKGLSPRNVVRGFRP